MLKSHYNVKLRHNQQVKRDLMPVAWFLKNVAELPQVIIDSKPASSLEAPNLPRDLVIILTCHLLHYDCMTRTHDHHWWHQRTLMTSVEWCILWARWWHSSLKLAKYNCPLINTPLIAIRLQTKLANLQLLNCNPNLQVWDCNLQVWDCNLPNWLADYTPLLDPGFGIPEGVGSTDILAEQERGGRPANELDWTRISTTWGWVSSLRLQSQTISNL